MCKRLQAQGLRHVYTEDELERVKGLDIRTLVIVDEVKSVFGGCIIGEDEFEFQEGQTVTEVGGERSEERTYDSRADSKNLRKVQKAIQADSTITPLLF
jgi:hypothetical protein